MCTSLDVAQYIYNKQRNNNVDPWKIQKLTYYAKAWSLAWDGDPLFQEQFEAWKDGPVSRELYAVKRYSTNYHDRVLPESRPERLTPRQMEVVDAVLDFYGDMETQELIDLTHREKPWIEARGGLRPGESCQNKLSDHTIRVTYTQQALIMNSVPKAPVRTTTKYINVTDEVILAHMEKWEETLDWLANK